ncbi:MAG TPA: DUF1453 domain-containing protein [Xanthomonadaceae bacterium]|nr:DUF1453 domain-containing protein [Xanthomonadaceae bacterium]
MPLLLLLPLLVACLFALWVVSLPLVVAQRYRHGRARRRVQPWYVRINAWLLAASAVGLLAFAAIVAQWVPDALRDAATGLAVGIAVGLLGMRLDRFESTPQGLFRTPHRGLLLALTLLLAGRIVLGAWLAWSDALVDGAWGLVSRAGLLAIGGVLLGHGVATTWGLRRRVRLRSPG